MKDRSIKNEEMQSLLKLIFESDFSDEFYNFADEHIIDETQNMPIVDYDLLDDSQMVVQQQKILDENDSIDFFYETVRHSDVAFDFANYLLVLETRSGKEPQGIYEDAGLYRQSYSHYLKGVSIPSFIGCVSLVIGLHLNLEQASDFMGTMGYIFPNKLNSATGTISKILEFFISRRGYARFDINSRAYVRGKAFRAFNEIVEAVNSHHKALIKKNPNIIKKKKYIPLKCLGCNCYGNKAKNIVDDIIENT